jgi:ribosomal-protein-alanine N-acetyltransferase
MINPFRVGRRVYFRPLERTDAPLVQPWFNDPEVTRQLLMYKPISLHAEEAFLEALTKSETDIVVMIVVRETDRPIGTVALHVEGGPHRQARFGLSIGARDEWGKGYGTEATALMVEYAFATLNLHRVWLQVLEYNKAGLRAYQKVGFREEGVLRQCHFAEGRYWDTIAMAILRDEWQSRQQAAAGKG